MSDQVSTEELDRISEITSEMPLEGWSGWAYLRDMIPKLVKAYDEAMQANAILENVCEHMATDHIVFQVLGNDEKVHPDWCVQCVLDRLREQLTSASKTVHYYLDENGKHHPGTWEDCKAYNCKAAHEAIATKMPFVEDEKRTEPYIDKLRDALIERVVWDHAEGHDRNTDWRACPMPTCTEIKELVDAAVD